MAWAIRRRPTSVVVDAHDRATTTTRVLRSRDGRSWTPQREFSSSRGGVRRAHEGRASGNVARRCGGILRARDRGARGDARSSRRSEHDVRRRSGTDDSRDRGTRHEHARRNDNAAPRERARRCERVQGVAPRRPPTIERSQSEAGADRQVVRVQRIAVRRWACRAGRARRVQAESVSLKRATAVRRHFDGAVARSIDRSSSATARPTSFSRHSPTPSGRRAT